MSGISSAKRQNYGDGRSMFGAPKHPDVAAKISIESPASARESVDELRPTHDSTYDRKLLIKRSFVLAANRAEAQTRREDLSSKEQGEMRAVHKIYMDAADQIEVD